MPCQGGNTRGNNAPKGTPGRVVTSLLGRKSPWQHSPQLGYGTTVVIVGVSCLNSRRPLFAIDPTGGDNNPGRQRVVRITVHARNTFALSSHEHPSTGINAMSRSKS